MTFHWCCYWRHKGSDASGGWPLTVIENWHRPTHANWPRTQHWLLPSHSSWPWLVSSHTHTSGHIFLGGDNLRYDDMEMTPSHHGPRSLASPQSLSQVTFPPHVSLISLATRMASSSIVADTRGLIQAYFITNLDWYDISNKLRPQYSLDFLGGQLNCLVTTGSSRCWQISAWVANAIILESKILDTLPSIGTLAELGQLIFKFACIGKFLWSYIFVHIVLVQLLLLLAWPLDLGPSTFGPLTWSLNLVPQLVPSTCFLNLVPQSMTLPSSKPFHFIPVYVCSLVVQCLYTMNK